MTSHDRGHYAKKHSGEKRKVDPLVADTIKKKASDEKITCAAAFKIAEICGTTADEIGFTVDILEIRIIRCQMGVFGYEPEKKAVKPMDSVPDELEKAIRDKLVNEKLACASAWEIARSLNVPKMRVSSACETLCIKIKSCQLGAF
ncbi:MAG: hypothetical protein PVG39_17400 [Desulfobacteraceae bacterium]|jgi:hypothetical protein